MAADDLTMTVNGQVYSGWKEIRTTRSLLHCAADFEIAVTERWAGQDQPWQIKRFDECTLSVGGDVDLTGYVEVYAPSFDATGHTVRIGGRSKTCDIVDCMPDIKGGQFTNFTLDKIAKALCAPFGIGVMVAPGTDLGEPFPDATIEKAETAFEFLEKLCGLRGVLALDDEKGNLVLAQAGSGGSASALVQGENILEAGAHLRSDNLFQKYVVVAQAPLAFDGQDAQLQIIGSATDSSCPRFRRFVESASDPADVSRANLRARWRAAHNFGEATQATITVQGWRQSGGDLWKVNQSVPVKCPWLELDQELLIGAVTKILDDRGGRRTELLVAPEAAFSPAPPKAKKPKGGSSSMWSGNIT
jgi:prophage tail gpP-like protein